MLRWSGVCLLHVADSSESTHVKAEVSLLFVKRSHIEKTEGYWILMLGNVSQLKTVCWGFSFCWCLLHHLLSGFPLQAANDSKPQTFNSLYNLGTNYTWLSGSFMQFSLYFSHQDLWIRANEWFKVSSKTMLKLPAQIHFSVEPECTNSGHGGKIWNVH